jgi:hypothetical protein
MSGDSLENQVYRYWVAAASLRAWPGAAGVVPRTDPQLAHRLDCVSARLMLSTLVKRGRTRALQARASQTLFATRRQSEGKREHGSG